MSDGKLTTATVSKDDANDLWLTYWTGDIRHRIKVEAVKTLYADYVNVIKSNCEVAEINATLQADLAALNARLERAEQIAQRRLEDLESSEKKGLEFQKLFHEWRRALQSLTPGGSEFTEPQECSKYVQRRLNKQWEAIKRMKAQRDTTLKGETK